MITQNPEPINPRTAWERYAPSEASPWDLKKAGHLYRCAAFGASWEELQSAVREGPERTITSLLQGRTDNEADELWTMMSRTIAAANIGPDGQNNGGQITSLWLYRMLYAALRSER